MFKNRAMQVTMVKTPKETVSSTTTGHWHIEPEQINEIAKDQVRNVASVTVKAVIAYKVLTTACEIAKIAAIKMF